MGRKVNRDSLTEDDQLAYTVAVDIEPVSEAELSEVKFGRSKVLRYLGLAVFASVVGSVIEASPAFACTTGSAPAPCGPAPSCCCCNSSGCCDANCTKRNSGCGPTGQGWNVYSNPDSRGCQKIYFCGDYTSGGSPCICKIYNGTIC